MEELEYILFNKWSRYYCEKCNTRFHSDDGFVNRKLFVIWNDIPTCMTCYDGMYDDSTKVCMIQHPIHNTWFLSNQS